ncbi:DUF3347 domain-containing protein [Dysgonomonas sp. ZJ279]|uniref:DUF3347 domain-containing protein n=1 Tax=Dysgonomonas sp. ZJ279 TaxID=2709796 RepID=UPI0013EA3AFD|nr:DUF3347 domain-containing protein [Dysgonomonas sp. ZJ279]
MKILLIFLAALLVSGAAFSQNQEASASALLKNYLDIKDALVKSDSKQAAVYASEMQATLEKETSLNEKEALLQAVQQVTKEKNIEKQRTAFMNLSTLMWNVVESSEGLTQDVYYQYCPMKKAYWLSTEKAIKNPYYGSKMLTCGSVEATKKK